LGQRLHFLIWKRKEKKKAWKWRTKQESDLPKIMQLGAKVGVIVSDQ